LITEVSLGYRGEGEDRILGESELGMMYNLNDRHAVGVTTYFQVDSEVGRWGLKARYRRWFTRDLSLNLSGGATFAFTGAGSDQRRPGLAGHVDVNYKDLVAPYLGVAANRKEDLHLTFHIGLRFGSYIGGSIQLGAAAVAVIVGLFLLGYEDAG
jgi:hypothetical protein